MLCRNASMPRRPVIAVHRLVHRLNLALGLALAFVGGALPAQVLLLYGAASQEYIGDVQTKLAASNLSLGTITIYDAYTNPAPTLAMLQQYQAVLAFTDSGGYQDPAGVGDALAAYVDAGGGVVEAVFGNGSIPITGQWQNGGYTPFNPGSQSSGSMLTLGTIYDPSSPLLAGVRTFSGGSSSYYSTGTLRAGAIRVADWSNGAPLIVLNPGFNGRIVSLNFFPPSSDIRSDFWDASTDGLQLMVNSLNFVAVPEPSTCMLLGLGGVMTWVLRRRRIG
jgi:hypothetical protein